jgi:hypothetical protein
MGNGCVRKRQIRISLVDGKECPYKMTETERRIVKMAILFELRLRFVYGDKESYTREQVTEMIDEMAVDREDETWF